MSKKEEDFLREMNQLQENLREKDFEIEKAYAEIQKLKHSLERSN
jgi:hypothetical protein